MELDGFILGVSSGVTCVAFCAPALVPYLLGEGKGISQNALLTVQFLLGRLLGYLLFAVLAWGVNRSILQGMSKPSLLLLIGAAYVVFSVLLLYYGFFRQKTACAMTRTNGLRSRLMTQWPVSIPLVAGFALGLSFCPPFLLAFSNALEKTSLLPNMLFFFAFFLGTAIFFIPTPFVGIFRGFSALKIIGKMAAGLIGVYYLYSGVVMLIG